MSQSEAKQLSGLVDRSPTARTLKVMEWLVNKEGAPYTALSRELGMSKATAYRVVSDLIELGWLRETADLRNRRLLVGPEFTSLAYSVIEQRTKWIGVIAILRNLADSIGEACTIAIQDADQVVFTESVQPDKPLTFVYPARTRAPLFCSSSGRIFMAEMSRELLEGYLRRSNRQRYTPATITGEAALKNIIQDVREKGYAATESQWVANVVGAAVAVRDTRSRCIAALSFNAPDTRVPFDNVPQFVPALKKAAEVLATELERAEAEP